MLRSGSALLALVLGLSVGCDESSTTLLIELVPNPEVNTRANVIERVNTLDITLDAAEGFSALDAREGETWGPYLVTDDDADGVLELLLTRPGGGRTLEPFAISQGSQAGLVLSIQARGVDTTEGNVTAFGGASTTFEADQQVRVELPFNLAPQYRPLRVLSMTPPQGAQNLEAPIESITLQLGGEVLLSAVEGHVTLTEAGADSPLEPTIALSYIDTAMGRMTNLRLLDCVLSGGAYEVVLEGGAICTTTEQCLDQHLNIDGEQPYIGSFTVAGEPRGAACGLTEVESLGCPSIPCEEGFDCVDEVCVLRPHSLPMGPEGEEVMLECDPELCAPPDLHCTDLGTCEPDCRPYGACPDPSLRCDAESGLCLE